MTPRFLILGFSKLERLGRRIGSGVTEDLGANRVNSSLDLFTNVKSCPKAITLHLSSKHLAAAQDPLYFRTYKSDNCQHKNGNPLCDSYKQRPEDEYRD